MTLCVQPRAPFAVAVAAAIGAIPSSSLAADANECWRLVASSDLIVVGKLSIPVSEGARVPDPNRYSEITIHVDRTLKGNVPQKHLTIRYATQPSPPQPSWDAIQDLGDRPVVALLAYVDPPGRPGLYFAQTESGSCSPLTPMLDHVVEALERDISREGAIAALKTPRAVRGDPMLQQVRHLVAQFRDCGRQEKAYERLVSLGTQAVPALITLMDDRSLLCKRHAAVRTSASGFEDAALYSPEVVTDLISIILTSATGESFGSLANGGSERVRRRVVAGWRTYLARSSEPSRNPTTPDTPICSRVLTCRYTSI